nr:uncharacterized protein LOC109431596 [Aedes albopictus]
MAEGQEQKPEAPGSSGTPGVIKVSMPMFGHMEPFVVGEKFDEYVSRLEQFFLVNEVPNNKKVPMLVTMAGPSLYSIASRICSPDDPCTKTYAQLIALLKKHLAPTVNVVAERYKFRKCEQSSSQTISDFIIELKAQSQSCAYNAFLQEALRDQFVAGVSNSNLRTKLLTEANLTFERACEIARSWEAAEQESKAMQGASKIAALNRRPVQKSFKPGKPTFIVQEKKNQVSNPAKKSSEPQKSCFRCGRSHNPESCPAKQWTCFACGRVGHVSTLCRSSKQKSSHQNRVAEMSEVVENWKLNRLSSSSEPSENAVEEESSSSTICVLGETESRRERIDVPATMELEIEGVPVKFEVDTGACDSVISKKTYQEKLSHVTLRRTVKCFQSVSGQDIRPEGELAVKVRNRSGDLVSLQLFVLQAERNSASPLYLVVRVSMSWFLNGETW